VNAQPSGSYRIELPSRRIEKQLDRLPQKDFERVARSLERLADNPRPIGVVKLRGRIHRMHVGAYRVIYSLYDQKKLIVITKVDRRKERTYKKLS
jgi:mRNA interferase RelE/StbE